MIRRPPRATRTDTLFPYTTLFRSTDIEVRDIVIPGDRQSGDPVTVSWTVRNFSDVIASGSWTDAVYLSRDATWDVGDILLGRADFSGTLLPDGRYTRSLATTLPGTAAGDSRVLVRTDVRNQLYVATGAGNKITASPAIGRAHVCTPVTT